MPNTKLLHFIQEKTQRKKVKNETIKKGKNHEKEERFKNRLTCGLTEKEIPTAVQQLGLYATSKDCLSE